MSKMEDLVNKILCEHGSCPSRVYLYKDNIWKQIVGEHLNLKKQYITYVAALN